MNPPNNSTNNPPDTTQTPNPTLSGKTLQVDWVYQDVGRCWTAWADHSCSLLSHEGGTISGAQDITGDGIADITCSQGAGISQTTTITNISTEPITIACEQYACLSCQASSDGKFAQCDGGIDPTSTRLSNTVLLTPGCVATCSLNGAYGSCLSQTTPPINPEPTQPGQPVPTQPNQPQPTTPVPTIAAGSLPVMVIVDNYRPEYSSRNSTYVYGWLTEGSFNGATGSARNQKISGEITKLKNTQGNTTKMMMVSAYATLEYLMANYKNDMKAAGITIIGYNTESPPVATPNTELQAVSDTTENNSVARLTRLAKQHGFDVIWGPIRNTAANVARNKAAIQQMVNAGLKGVAFQEQQFIEGQSAAARELAVTTDAGLYREIGPNLEIHVQIMASRCGTRPWSKCKDFVSRIRGNINSLAIWSSGAEGTNGTLSAFIKEMQGY